MNYISVTITGIDESTYYTILADFFDIEYAGVEELDNEYVFFFEADKWNERHVQKLQDMHIEFKIEQIEKKNWNEVWESNFTPVEIDDFCYIRAHFHPERAGFEHQILITPKMSFGTGHHATTHMMMKGMKDIDLQGKSVFDYGTGTGILAIFAEQRGAKKIDAIDIDEWSVENTIENIENNQCTKITTVLSELVPPYTTQKYDVILANINRNIILQSMHNLNGMLVEEGILLISGILESDIPDIIKEANSYGLKASNTAVKDKWAFIEFVAI